MSFCFSDVVHESGNHIDVSDAVSVVSVESFHEDRHDDLFEGLSDVADMISDIDSMPLSTSVHTTDEMPSLKRDYVNKELNSPRRLRGQRAKSISESPIKVPPQKRVSVDAKDIPVKKHAKDGPIKNQHEHFVNQQKRFTGDTKDNPVAKQQMLTDSVKQQDEPVEEVSLFSQFLLERWACLLERWVCLLK